MPTPVTAAHNAAVSVFERGFAIVPNVFSTNVTQQIADVAMHVASAELAANPDESFIVDRSASGRLAPRKIDYPFLKHESFRSFILDERIQELVNTILGKQGYLMRDQVFCKPPRFGTAKPYHQENASLLYRPADKMIVTWIALDDATEENGCLRVIEGSHRKLWSHSPMPGAPYNHIPPDEAIDLEQEVALEVPSGGVVVMHSQVLHSSHPNHSEQWRRAYTGHWVTRDISCDSDAQRYGYSRTVGGGECCAYRAP